MAGYRRRDHLWIFSRACLNFYVLINTNGLICYVIYGRAGKIADLGTGDSRLGNSSLCLLH